MSMQMNIIWSNEVSEIESLMENNPELVWDTACELNADYLDDEKANLNIEVGDEIVIIADLDLWDGHHQAYKCTHKTNIADVLVPDNDYVKFFVDDRGDLMARSTHHDGTNIYTYRAWKDGISYAQRSYFLQKVAIGKATRKDITRYTRKIGTYVADVYGWKVRK